MPIETRLYAAALVLLAIFLFLGRIVTRGPLGLIDARAVALRAHATPLALAFTLTGRAWFLTAASIVAVGVYAWRMHDVIFPIAIVLSQIVSQMIVELFKSYFARTRPDYWLVGLEGGHSFPSGHATTAVIFFLGWAVGAAFSPLPPDARYPIAAVLLLWAIGIGWSRLALGAHYVTDVLGGTLFGSAWLCALFAAIRHFAAAAMR